MSNLVTDFKGRMLALGQLPALPAALHEVTRIMESPHATTEQIAQVMSYDQALTAQVLRMVNSPIYGFPGRISSLQHALTLLGFNVIQGVIISTAVFDAINTSMMGLWEHSLGCSLCCAEIARVAQRKNPEGFAVAGLLHDIGKSVFILQMPDAKTEIDALVQQNDISFFEAEAKVLGVSHDRINKWLGEHWNLPLVIREGMVHHHNPLSAQFYPEVAAAVQVGDFLVRLHSCGFAGDEGVNAIDPRALKLLGITQQRLETLLDTVSEQMFSVIAGYKG